MGGELDDLRPRSVGSRFSNRGSMIGSQENQIPTNVGQELSEHRVYEEQEEDSNVVCLQGDKEGAEEEAADVPPERIVDAILPRKEKVTTSAKPKLRPYSKGGKTTSKKPSLFGKTRRKKNKPSAKTRDGTGITQRNSGNGGPGFATAHKSKSKRRGKRARRKQKRSTKDNRPIDLEQGAHALSTAAAEAIRAMELEERRVEAESRTLREGHSEEVETSNFAEPNDGGNWARTSKTSVREQQSSCSRSSAANAHDGSEQTRSNQTSAIAAPQR